jgi:hypothetical protein
MWRRLCAVLAVTIAFLMVTPAFAEAPIRLVVNGHALVMDVEPIRVNGRIMVPARFVAEALGATVGWDQDTQSVVITSKETAKASSTAAADTFDLAQWISLRELADRGVSVTAGPDGFTRLSRNGVVVFFGQLPSDSDGLTVPASVTGSSTMSVTLAVYQSRTFLRLDDARALGFVE